MQHTPHLLQRRRLQSPTTVCRVFARRSIRRSTQRSLYLRSASAKLLQDAIDRRSHPTLYCKLGDVYTNRGDLVEAIENYQISLSIDPNNELAQLGLDRAEKLTQDGDGEVENNEEMEDADEHYQ